MSALKNKFGLENMLVDKSATISQAMKQIDETGKRIVFVQDGERLFGSLSDGDIRRFLMRGGKVEGLVRDAANKTPKFLFDTQRSGAIDYMLSNGIHAVPIVDNDLNVIDVVLVHEEVDISAVTMRELLPSDMERIMAFFDQMAGDTRAMFNRGDVNRVRVIQYLEENTPNEKHFCATVEINGKETIVGYVFLWETNLQVPWLGIAVHERWKGFHLGRVLLSYLDEYAKGHNYGGLMLTTVPANIRAQSLYTNMGYEYMGSHMCGEYMYLKRFSRENGKEA